MNLDDIDLEKLKIAATDLALMQSPRVRLALVDRIAEPGVDIVISEDPDDYLRLSIDGASFGRVHPSRVAKNTATPWWQ